ncbi:MAG: hypothetical protein ABI571_05535 [Actinomycetota bacterium]|jgi:hypothetical protein|nr:hypothetical protein [Actinomycetota bacterium]
MGSEKQAIRGQRPLGLPRASQKYAEGRICDHPGCETRLSTYNRRDRCWAHAEMKVPRLRGRKPAAGSA